MKQMKQRMLRGLAFAGGVSYGCNVFLATQGAVNRLQRGVRDERGQVMMEYVLLATIILIATMGFSIAFQRAIKSYLLGVYFWMSLPVP